MTTTTAVAARPPLAGSVPAPLSVEAPAEADSLPAIWSDAGHRLPLDPPRWHAEPDALERRLVATLGGPVLDVGCGPGRIVAALVHLGVDALGVDLAPGAVELARNRGAPVVQGSVFDRLPDEGGWETVVLFDGNIGIDGDPLRLLRRCRELVAPRGTIVAEVQAPGQRSQRCRARLVCGYEQGAWFRWAVVSADALPALAAEAGLELTQLYDAGDQRWFSHLRPDPAGLFRLTQGLHVISGIASLPVLVAKLWLVWPRVLSFPPFRRVGDVIERLGILLLVGGGIFMIFSGVSNIALWYPWPFSFRRAHYWVAWVTIGGLVAHIGAKWMITRQALRRPTNRPALAEADPVLDTSAEGDQDGLSRRGFLATVGAATGALTVVTAGQSVPVLRPFALLAPRDSGERPINRTAAMAGVDRVAPAAFVLAVEGNVAQPLRLSLADVASLATRQARLPIACVEGWSFSAPWRGVALPTCWPWPAPPRTPRCASSPWRAKEPSAPRGSTTPRPTTPTPCWPPTLTARSSASITATRCASSGPGAPASTRPSGSTAWW